MVHVASKCLWFELEMRSQKWAEIEIMGNKFHKSHPPSIDQNIG